jgi:hypothetical protein
MENYLLEFKKSEIVNICLEVQKEVNNILDVILKESKCNVYLIGGKSVDLYSSIVDDLTKKGYSVCYYDRLYKEDIYHEVGNAMYKDYILLTDSINKGNEICDCINVLKCDPKKIISNFAYKNGVDNIIKSTNIQLDKIYICHKIDEPIEYRKILLRNKIYCYNINYSLSLFSVSLSRMVLTKLKKDDIIQKIENEIRSYLKCNKISIIRGDIENIALINLSTRYYCKCLCEQNLCQKILQNYKIFKLKPLFIDFPLDVTDTIGGFIITLSLDITYNYDNNYPPGLNNVECEIEKIIPMCIIKEMDISDKELRKLQIMNNCQDCIDENIHKDILNNILDKFEKSL